MDTEMRTLPSSLLLLATQNLLYHPSDFLSPPVHFRNFPEDFPEDFNSTRCMAFGDVRSIKAKTALEGWLRPVNYHTSSCLSRLASASPGHSYYELGDRYP